MKRTVRRNGWVVVLALTLAVNAVGGAQQVSAAFPGLNGKIAFTTDRDGDLEIYVMNADGSGQTNLTSNPASDFQPAWSPDGQRIAFTTDRDGDFEIYVMNADGSGQTNLTSNPAADFQPAWSPDGQRIAFTSLRDGNSEIYAMNADGSGQTNLTSNPATDRDPAWSPDGQRIAFTSLRDGNSEIYAMNADGSGQTNLTANTALDEDPDWQPAFSADLVLGLATSPYTAKKNRPLTNTITVANHGPTAAWGIVVTDTLPSESRLVSVSSSRGTCTAPPAGSNGTITCSLGSLDSGGIAVIRIEVTIVIKKGTVTNSASVTSGTSDPNLANNSASVSVQVK